MIEIFALAVLDALVAVAQGVAPALGAAAHRVREAARPPRGVELRSDDGSLFTGLVVVDRNVPVLLLAARVGERREAPRPPLVTPAAEPRPPYFGGQRPLHFDPEDDPRWGPDPFARR